MKREINVFDYGLDIVRGIKSAALVTTKNGDKVNSMTISWGTIGIEWEVPIFIAFIREGRFTREQVDATGEFTVNITYRKRNSNILRVCGAKSGRDTDKVKELGLTLIDGDMVSAPAVKEFPLTLECKVLYRQPQDFNLLPKDFSDKFYPQDVDSTAPLCNKDNHIAYYGQILKAYIVE